MLKPPAHSHYVILSYPADHVLQVTFNRATSLNSLTRGDLTDMRAILDWFEDEPSLWVVILTGAGRVFCAGADLKEWNTMQSSRASWEQQEFDDNPNGFAAASRRRSNKVLIAAVNGGAHGGGLEIVLNCDLVIAAEDAKFSFPEARVGVYASQGGIPRLSQIAGHQRAAEMLLLGSTVSAQEAYHKYGFVNRVVKPDKVVDTAIQLAKHVTANSPDSIQVTKLGLILPQTHTLQESQAKLNWSETVTRLYTGENIKEGLKAFSERRKPKWKNPAKLPAKL